MIFLNFRNFLVFRYKVNAEEVASKFRDRPHTPIDTSVFWIEYVVRHKGAPELKSVAANLTWYQYYLVDVISVITGSVFLCLYLLYFVISKLVSLLLNKSQIKIEKS